MSSLYRFRDSATIRPESSGEIIVDNFAGGGGASLGIELALGRPVDLAINHDPAAVAMHELNHPATRHLHTDIREVDPVLATRGRPVGLAWFSPDCFPAGTMVLTREGYRPIEQITVGDEVLTHRGRWRKVIQTHSTIRPLVSLKGHGHPGLMVSPEHPFYARHRRNVWDNHKRRYERTLETAAWVPASTLGRDWYWATPTRFPELPIPAVPVYRDRTLSISAKLMFLAGRYLADGWTRLTETRAELVISTGRHKAEAFEEFLGEFNQRQGARSGADEFAWHRRETATATQFTTSCRGLVEWLREHFGHGAAEKLIPGWVLGMSEEYRTALLAGYMAGDGWKGPTAGNEIQEASTVSKALAFGLKSLAASLGATVLVYHGERKPATIEGREVSTLPYWKVRWRTELAEAHRQTWREDGLEWAPIRDMEDTGASAEVFNLGVADDESYVVEGIIVHNCTHFSRAKGSVPVSKKIRGLAWVVVKWARTVRPRVMILENVREFQTWGPLGADGRPCKARAGRTFDRWKRAIERAGYAVEFRMLNAADYGAPTHRRRLFLIARRDGLPIVWPDATHGGKKKPFRTAAGCIDWSIPCSSIFTRKKPLAEKTQRRIALGIKRYVLDNPKPFLVRVNHGGEHFRGQPTDQPLATVTARHGFGVCVPHISTYYGDNKPSNEFRGHAVDEPLRVQPTENRHALCAAFLAKHYGDRGQRRGIPADEPAATITACDHHSLVTGVLVGNGGSEYAAKPRPLDSPKGVVLPQDRSALAAVNLVHLNRHTKPTSPEEPLPTVASGGNHAALAAANLIRMNHGEKQWNSVEEPLVTVTSQGNKAGLVYAFLAKYFGTAIGQPADDPLRVPYALADIGMRMLSPRELARAQGFPDDYILPGPKYAQVAAIGNSVCPAVAQALVKANYRPKGKQKPVRKSAVVGADGGLF